MSKRTILSATALLGIGFLAGWLVGPPGADAPPHAEDSPPTSVETARSDASESPMPAAPKPKEGPRVRITRTPSPGPGKRGLHPRTGTGLPHGPRFVFDPGEVPSLAEAVEGLEAAAPHWFEGRPWLTWPDFVRTRKGSPEQARILQHVWALLHHLGDAAVRTRRDEIDLLRGRIDQATQELAGTAYNDATLLKLSMRLYHLREAQERGEPEAKRPPPTLPEGLSASTLESALALARLADMYVALGRRPKA